MPATILERIVDTKRAEVNESLRSCSREEMARRAEQNPEPQSFRQAIKQEHVSLIAEIKKASPAAGVIRPDFDAVAIARCYARGGASALSVLTDETYFQGSLEVLRQVRAAVTVPLLRKDFVIDSYQIHEARAAGADAVLLIVAILEETRLSELLAAAAGMRIDALVEVHTRDEMQMALRAGATLIGINNRNLKTFETRLETTAELASMAPGHVTLAALSGIATRDHVQQMAEAGADAILVGESLMRQTDVESAARSLTGVRAQKVRKGHVPRVKICGITCMADAAAAVDAGANYLGFMFSESPRQVEPETAASIIRELPPSVQAVGVFVDAALEEVLLTLEQCKLQIAQLHGSEDIQFARSVGPHRVWKAFRIGCAEDLDPISSYRNHVSAVMLDAFVPGKAGGTGKQFNWKLARNASHYGLPVVLAGGLAPGNVAAAIREVHPSVVDVSSGVESSPGRKDAGKLRAFIEAVTSSGVEAGERHTDSMIE